MIPTKRMSYELDLHIYDRENKLNEPHDLLKENFRIDALGMQLHAKTSKEEQLTYPVLKKTTRQIRHRWENGLLSKSNDVVLPNNYEHALRNLFNIEKKIDQDSVVLEKYCNKTEES